jgi:ABC-2 type transport system permease protein
MTATRLLSILAVETKYEFLKLVRMPAYAAPVLFFPLMFYVIFGLSFGGARAMASSTMASYMLASMGTFGVIGAAMFGLGVYVASERGQGWLTVKRASRMPMVTYLGAKMLVAMIFGAIIVACLFTLGATFGHVTLSPGAWASLGAVLVLGSIPFCALGLAVGYLAGPNSAQPIVNLLYLPMAFASGLWMPLEILPQFIRRIAPFLPPFHLSQLALDVTGIKPAAEIPMHFIVLTAFTALFLGLAAVGYRRDEGKTYG